MLLACMIKCEITINAHTHQHLLIFSGGGSNTYQLVEYDIDSNSFNDIDQRYLLDTLNNQNGEYGIGIYFTQIDTTTMYFIHHPNGDHINKYNLQDLTYEPQIANLPTSVSSTGCIASSMEPVPALYITGGTNGDNLKDLQVFNITAGGWLSGEPSMQFARKEHGCVVVNGELWAMGWIVQVETINITNIESKQWQEIGNLSVAKSRIGLTVVDDIIWIIGGNPGDTSDVVFTIDTKTRIIAVESEKMPYKMPRINAVAVDHVIYGFGGEYYGAYDEWISLQLLRRNFTF